MAVRFHAAVVGAGLSGLTAALRLTQAGWDVTVLEAADAVGGRTRTVRAGGYAIDTGASALGTSYRAYLDLVRELGLAVHPAAPQVGVLRGDTLHHLRLDRLVRSGLTTRLLSPADKLRAARLGRDVLRARRRLDYADMGKAAPLDTESARAYATRTLSPALDAYLAEPVTRTMLIADSDVVSKVELLSGIANIFTTEICCVAGGQGAVAEALATRLDVRTGTRVGAVRDHGDHVTVDGERYDACVVACELPAAAAITGARLPALDSTRCLKVALGTTRRPASPAFLAQLSSRESPDVALIFLDHNKAPDRAPAGRALLDCCWEAGASARAWEASDDELVERSLAVCRRALGDVGEVELSHVTRWAHALPHTRPGAYREIAAFRPDPAGRVQFAGDYLSAAGQNTAVAFGERAARSLQANLTRDRIPAAWTSS